MIYWCSFSLAKFIKCGSALNKRQCTLHCWYWAVVPHSTVIHLLLHIRSTMGRVLLISLVHRTLDLPSIGLRQDVRSILLLLSGDYNKALFAFKSFPNIARNWFLTMLNISCGIMFVVSCYILWRLLCSCTIANLYNPGKVRSCTILYYLMMVCSNCTTQYFLVQCIRNSNCPINNFFFFALLLVFTSMSAACLHTRFVWSSSTGSAVGVPTVHTSRVTGVSCTPVPHSSPFTSLLIS